MFSLRTLEHLVLAGIRIARQMSHICDIHDALDIISHIAERLFEQIFHDIASQIPNMCVVIHGRSTGIHRYFAILIWNKALYLPCQCIVKRYFVFHLLSNPPKADYYVFSLSSPF